MIGTTFAFFESNQKSHLAFEAIELAVLPPTARSITFS